MFKRTNDGTVKIHGWYLDSIEDAWNTALEEAALVADDIANDMLTQISKEHGPWMKAAAEDIAAAIRALKE